MKTFKEFINENFKDLLKGKSEEEIKKELDKLSDIEKLKMISKYNLPDKYIPKIINKIKKQTIEKIKTWSNRYVNQFEFLNNIEDYDINIKTTKVKHPYEKGNLYYNHIASILTPDGLLVNVNSSINWPYLKSYTIPYEDLNIKVIVQIILTIDRFEERHKGYYGII